MQETFLQLFQYLKNPVLEKDTKTDFLYRFRVFFHIWILSICTSALLMPFFYIIEYFQFIDMEKHTIDELMESMSKPMLFFLTVILAPCVEELIFRAPLTLFKSRNTFPIAFYSFTLFFGFIHISNYEITTNVLLLSPILIAPQIILGGYLGFIRVRFGLGWSIFLHAAYNGFFMLLTFAGESI